MEMKQKNTFTFGDLRIAAYMVWGKGLADKMVRLAINSSLVALPGLPLRLNPSAKWRSA
jgi:hypothetical protein